jgi:16S rRNA (adenine1518-N6/adenine1519-N6)-dimethyltransferase
MITPMKILKMHGIRPRKRLGQAFLQDPNVLRKIVAAADIRGDETVVEIGAGLGIMTEVMASRAGRVIAIEVDPVMAGILRERLQDRMNIDIVETDVLQYDFSSARSDLRPEKIKVVGNLPYQISSPILFRLLDFRHVISTAILMLQKEVVDRITASPGSKDYGIPTVMVSMYCRTRRLMDVPGGCFYPEPRVDSAVVKLTMREKPLVPLEEDDAFRNIVRTAFSRRRKTLLNNLRLLRWPGCDEKSLIATLQEAGIDGLRRAETLSAEEFGMLARKFVSLKKNLDSPARFC